MIPDIPIFTLLVAFLHELGHATGCLLTGGHVIALQVNQNGSGLCTTSGGNSLIVTAGGYLGSIIFGNLMLYFGIKHRHLSKNIAIILSLIMIIASVTWFSTFQSFIITFAFGAVLMVCFFKIAWSGRVFMIGSGAYSIHYIIKDYNIGPSSDLQSFSGVLGLSSQMWMYIWLAGAIFITFSFLRLILKK